MYKEHFGLQRALFEGGIAREEGVFLGPRQQLVIANLKIALTTRDSIATLAGPVGVGKTTLASQALRMAATRLALAWIGGAPLSPDEMLELLLAEFDFTPYGMGRVERMHTWRQFITELNATDTRVCILVENAQAIGAEALQALGPLTAADPNGCPGANLVIMGETGLYEFFENPVLAQLSQRIRSRQRVDPLSVAEVEAYLRRRTAAAGGEFEKLFAPGAGPALHCYTGGIPRVIDNVCETALALAAAGKQPRLTPADLMRVADRMYALPPQGPIPATPKQTKAPAPNPVPAAPAAKAEPAATLPAAVPAHAAMAAEAHEPKPSVTEPEPAVETTDSSPEEPPVTEPEPAVEKTDSAPAEPPTLTEVVEDEPAPLPREEKFGDATSDSTDADEIIELDIIDTAQIEVAIAEAEAAEDEAPAAAMPTPPAELGVEHVFEAEAPEEIPELVVEDLEPAPEPEVAKAVAREPKPEVDPKLAQTLAEARSLEDISNSMAEAVFGDDDIDMLAAALDAAVPGAAARRESGSAGLSPEETSAVLQLAEDAIAEPAEATESEPGPTPPSAEAAS